jgi:hypothetical protein
MDDVACPTNRLIYIGNRIALIMGIISNVVEKFVIVVAFSIGAAAAATATVVVVVVVVAFR